MNLTIRFPDAIDVPAEIPVLTVRTSRWTGPEISRLARSMDVVGKPVDVGLWQVARDERAALEIYQASQSFRFTRVDLDPEGRDGLDPTVTPDQAWSVAEGWIEAFGPDGIRREVHSVTEHEVLIAVRDAGEPRSAIVGLDVNYRFSLDGWALLGPGAKAKVSVHPTGVVGGAYRFWRDAREAGAVRTLPVDVLVERFSASTMFADLHDGIAAARVDEARFGYLSLAPTETMGVLVPVLELRGTVSTEAQPRYEFVTHVSAVELYEARTKEARVLNARPTRLLA